MRWEDALHRALEPHTECRLIGLLLSAHALFEADYRLAGGLLITTLTPWGTGGLRDRGELFRLMPAWVMGSRLSIAENRTGTAFPRSLSHETQRDWTSVSYSLSRLSVNHQPDTGRIKNMGEPGLSSIRRCRFIRGPRTCFCKLFSLCDLGVGSR